MERDSDNESDKPGERDLEHKSLARMEEELKLNEPQGQDKLELFDYLTHNVSL